MGDPASMGGSPDPFTSRGRAMRLPSCGGLGHQIDTLRRQFFREGGLPFADVLTADCLDGALRAI